MSDLNHIYRRLVEIPKPIANFLDGAGLEAKSSVGLSTVGADGWPHGALLSASAARSTEARVGGVS